MNNEVIKLKQPNCIEIKDGSYIYYGGNQEWYTSTWRVRAGCGPTNAALFCLYMSLAHPGLSGLAPISAREKQGFIDFMDEIWDYVTPTKMGVYHANIFIKGMRKYVAEKGIDIDFVPLYVPVLKSSRPTEKEVAAFLTEAFEKDAIIPFLNNDNGKESRLDAWHWVSLISFEPESGNAVIADEGIKKDINLYLWLKTSRLGGAFVGLTNNFPPF